MRARAFAPNEFVLITAPSDPLAKLHSVRVEELGERPWLLREPGSGTRTVCEEYLAAHALTPRILTLGSNGAIKQASAVGLGVALQSRIAVALELELGVFATISVRGGLPKRAWHVVHPAVGPQRSEARAFEEFLDSRAARQLLAAPLRRELRLLREHYVERVKHALGHFYPGIVAHQADPPDRRGARTEAAPNLDAVVAQHPRLDAAAIYALRNTDGRERRKLVVGFGEQLETPFN